jgi:hypothetical protein
MPIILPAGFNVTSTEPVDARFTLANASARLGLSVANVYEGLIVYQRDNDTIYVLANPAQPSLEVSWQIVGANVSGSLLVTGSITSLGGFTGSLFGTASWAINAVTASFLLGSVATASLAFTASNTPNALITASVSLNTITFTKGDGSTFPITVNTGSGGGGGGGGGTTTNSLFFNASGSGSAPGTSFNGSVAFTASYNTVGANKVITSGPTAPSGGMDGDYYFQYDVSNTLFFNRTRKTSSYTIAGSDIGRLIEMDSGSANTLTIPTNASVPIPLDARFTVTQYGAGQTTFASGSGVTVRSRSNFTKISARYGFANLVKIGTDEWYLYGDLSA